MTYEKMGNAEYLVDEVAGDQKVTEAFYVRLDGLAFKGDYKTQLDGIITTLESEALYLTRDDRKRIIDIITSKYVEQTETTPSDVHLERMTDVVLHEEIRDPHPDKIARNEYPIMSDRQYKDRRSDEVADNWAEEVGVDGRDYRPRTRDNNRKMREATGTNLRDKDVHARNKEARKRYRQFTKVQPVYTYYIENPPE